MGNNEIREIAKKNNVKLWQVADALEISEATLTRLLRRELPEEKRTHFIRIIRNLSSSQREGQHE